MLLLAGCGALPRPFAGRPGATALRLAQPPPARLAVPLPGESFLTPASAHVFADDLADALVAQGLPVLPGAPQPGDWSVVPSVTTEGNSIVPHYRIDDAKHVSQGVAEGARVSAQDWVQAQPGMLKAVAADAAPKLAALLEGINAARAESDPTSLRNRPARVFVQAVTGAPGDGNSALARQIRNQLGLVGLVVQDTETGADYVLDTEVMLSPLPGNQSQIEIDWIVQNPAGDVQGKVAQLNEIPLGSLDHFWGDVAVVVSRQAADGIHDIILNQTHPNRSKPPAS